MPFTTEMRDDPNLPVGQTKTIQAGVPGVRRDIFQVTTRDDGTVVTRDQIGYELLTPPVSQVVVKGTQPTRPRGARLGHLVRHRPRARARAPTSRCRSAPS